MQEIKECVKHLNMSKEMYETLAVIAKYNKYEKEFTVTESEVQNYIIEKLKNITHLDVQSLILDECVSDKHGKMKLCKVYETIHLNRSWDFDNLATKYTARIRNHVYQFLINACNDTGSDDNDEI